MQTGLEAGFAIYRHLTSCQNEFTPVFEGSSEAISPGCFEAWKQARLLEKLRWKESEIGELYHLHFHPDRDEMFPSFEDLGFLDDRRPILRPIVSIGCVGENLNGSILQLQKKIKAQLGKRPDGLNLSRTRGGNAAEPGLIEHLYERCEDYGWLWPLDKEEYCCRIAVPGYVQAGVLEFRVPAASSAARVGNAHIMKLKRTCV